MIDMTDPTTPPSGSTVNAFAVPRLALFYSGFFLVIGVLMPFWPLWLKSRGLGAAEIGIVLASGMWIKVLINPFTSALADHLGERKRLIAGLSVMAFASFTLFAFVHSFWPVLLVSMLFFAFWAPMIPLGESLTMLTAARRSLDYGRIRLWGSLSFIIAAGTAGRILAGRPADLVYWLVLGAVGVAVGFCFLLPDIRAPKAAGRRLLILDVLRDKSFLIFLAAAGMVQTSHAVYYAFGTLHWRAAGYTETVIGALWAEGVIAEIGVEHASRPQAYAHADPHDYRGIERHGGGRKRLGHPPGDKIDRRQMRGRESEGVKKLDGNQRRQGRGHADHSPADHRRHAGKHQHPGRSEAADDQA